MAGYIRHLKRRSNKRRVIKGYGILDQIKNYYAKTRSRLRRNIPKAWKSIKSVGKRHIKDVIHGRVPLTKEHLINKGKDFAREAFQEARRDLSGEGRLKRLRTSFGPYSIPKRVRYSNE